MSGLVRVTRLSRLLDRYRRWDVVLDGEPAGAVANGGIAEMLVDSGPHTLRVGHRWWASPTLPFTVKNLQTVEFVCRPRPHPMVWVPYGVASLYRRDVFIVLAPMPATASRPVVARHGTRSGRAETLWMDG
jgi:hypothetical protein